MTTIDRAAFLGTGAAVAASTAAAGAQTMELGKPHAPFVPENDPAVSVSRITLSAPAGPISAYVAQPQHVTATTPGIVMVVHIWGADAVLRDYARRFAKAGYIAILPGLFDRFSPPSGDAASDIAPFAAVAKQMYAANTQGADLLAAHDWVAKKTRGKIGIYGNCMGGGIALQQLVGNTNYAAAVELYGYVRADRAATEPPPAGAFDWAASVSAATLGLYGGADTGINPADVAAAFALMKGPHEYKVYPDAPHAFLDDTRASYRPAAAEDAWPRMLAWYGKYLATP